MKKTFFLFAALAFFLAACSDTLNTNRGLDDVIVADPIILLCGNEISIKRAFYDSSNDMIEVQWEAHEKAKSYVLDFFIKNEEHYFIGTDGAECFCVVSKKEVRNMGFYSDGHVRVWGIDENGKAVAVSNFKKITIGSNSR